MGIFDKLFGGGKKADDTNAVAANEVATAEDTSSAMADTAVETEGQTENAGEAMACPISGVSEGDDKPSV